MRPKHLVTFFALPVVFLAALLTLAGPAAPAHAGGVVSVCDEAHLRVALAGGGTVTFSCSGTITLTAEIVIAADTTIDGSGQAVTISGNQWVRVFTVKEGVTLTLNTLTVADGSAPDGGGIYSVGGTVNANNSTFSGNRANNSYPYTRGGAIYNVGGTVIVNNSAFSGNSVGSGLYPYGGGIYSASGTVSVSNSTFRSNGGAGFYSSGGGIYSKGVLTVSNSTFTDNSAGIYGGGGGIHSEGPLTVSDSTFARNYAGYGGGGIHSEGPLTVSDSTFARNYAGYGGGGIRVSSTMTVSNSTFDGNRADDDGGGIFNWGYGTLTVSNCIFSGNGAGRRGGGILNADTLIVSNCTFAGNSAVDGGGINNWGYGTLTVSNSTFVGNSAVDGGGIGNSQYSTVTLQNTIVADSPEGGNCSGTITDGGGNLSYPDATCPGINRDPMLGPLQDNGGPTWTMALLSGSAAIDAADDAICAAEPVNNRDQRGVTRPQGPHCDIGAYRSEASAHFPADHHEIAHSQPPATRWSWAAQFDQRRRNMRPQHLMTLLALPAVLLAILLTLAAPAAPVHAGGIVSVCDEAHLRAALAGGGTVTFSCSGTITLTAEIVITADTTIDGSGQAVTISGNHAVRVFTMNPGAVFNLNALTVADGSADTGGGILNSFGARNGAQHHLRRQSRQRQRRRRHCHLRRHANREQQYLRRQSRHLGLVPVPIATAAE